VVPRFITAGLASVRPVVYGDGRQSRDFVFIDDVVTANLLAAAAPGASGLTANIGSGERSSLLDLLAAVGTAVGPQDPVFEPARAGDVRDSQASTALAADRLGFRAAIALPDGIRRTVAWYRSTAAAPV
jgi:nucleoside-diphosphate-sugar epimerase